MSTSALPTTASTTTVGVLGGMSWESTALYYRTANELVRAHRSPQEPMASADLLVRSLDFAPVRELQLADRWDEAADLLRREGLALAGAGAGVVVVATNYMHKAAGPLEEALAERGTTFLHLADVVAQAALARGARTVGLLGAGGTMTEPFYAERLARSGVEVVVPDAAGVARVDAAVFGELCRGVFSATTRADLAAVVGGLVGRGAEAVGLCCTELELLLGPDDAPTGVPLLPSARLHVEAALAAAGQVPAAGPTAGPAAGAAVPPPSSLRRVRALQYAEPGGSLTLVDLPDAAPPAHGAVLAVEATGLCRSDVHAWAGHDPDVVVGAHAGPGGTPLTHVPGHELVGRVVAVGADVDPAWVGRRATTPFVHACGSCPECLAGDGQVCRDQSQPGFTAQGSWAEQVVVQHAAVNLVAVPDDVDGGAAALLGCRFATAYRGLVQRARLQAGERVLVVGCGGVGLSAVMVAAAIGAEVVAADVDERALARAVELGATATVRTAGLSPAEVAEAVVAAGGGAGVAVSVDAVGRPGALDACLASLARRGRHVQIGLVATEPVVEVSRVITHELAVLGSHGMDARSYPELMELVTSGRLRPQDLVARWLPLDDAAGVEALVRAMDEGTAPVGVTMIRP